MNQFMLDQLSLKSENDDDNLDPYLSKPESIYALEKQKTLNEFICNFKNIK